MPVTHAYAILAPLPEAHLAAAQQVCQREGKVAFGSRSEQLFRKIDLSRVRDTVDVFIYAANPEVDLGAVISWHGVYVGQVQALPDGTHPDKARYRPLTAYDTDCMKLWTLYWEMENLQPIQPIKIETLRGFDQEAVYAASFVPKSPVLIEHPRIEPFQITPVV
ncbi:MAG: hypothetical protein HC921_14660 [Synechococcaceae cyanobacterium SM2_3_1]|nr:hypothetical protein [Synechococcaceae cyanobacterium SM2_3_1]